jgi:hypothetical protein
MDTLLLLGLEGRYSYTRTFEMTVTPKLAYCNGLMKSETEQRDLLRRGFSASFSNNIV